MRYRVDQGSFDLPPPPRAEPDYEGESRAELTGALAAAKAAVDRPPWDYRQARLLAHRLSANVGLVARGGARGACGRIHGRARKA
jgi:hypothetical protein